MVFLSRPAGQLSIRPTSAAGPDHAVSQSGMK